MPQAVQVNSVPAAFAPTGNIIDHSRLPEGLRPPVDLAKIALADQRFWELHGAWREAESAFEAWGPMPDECDHAQALYDRSTELFDDMLATGVRSACALSMKIEAVSEGGWGLMDMELTCGLTVAEVIRADIERLAKIEMWGAVAFEQTAGEMVQ